MTLVVGIHKTKYSYPFQVMMLYPFITAKRTTHHDLQKDAFNHYEHGYEKTICMAGSEGELLKEKAGTFPKSHKWPVMVGFLHELK